MFVPRINEIKDFEQCPQELLRTDDRATVVEAATKMSCHHVGCLAVYDDQDNFVGLISERDMLSKVIAEGMSPEDLYVSDIMTSSVISISSDTTIAEAERLLAKHKIRHLPVVKDDKPIGMISSRDLIAYRIKNTKAMQAAAEQLAMLPTGLKSLDFEDVVDLAINEVPKSFGAENAVLCLAQESESYPLIRENGCPHCHKDLIEKLSSGKLPQSPRLMPDTACPGFGDGECLLKMVIPLSIQDQSANGHKEKPHPGFLCMCRPASSTKSFDQTILYKASLLQQMLNTNLTNAKLYRNYQDARRDSETDPLTGVGTRRVLERVLKAECARAKRYERTFCVAIADLDNFKKINDTAGHATGDQALKKLAKLMRHNIRETDIVITRYGGDEFVLVMPETRITGGKVLLERIRRQMKTISLGSMGTPTISCGLAEYNAEPADAPDDIMSRADEALYEAKRTGRNRVVAHEPQTTTV